MTVYEVVSPFSLVPFCTTVHKFSEQGHRPFFTSLFACSDWGLRMSDIAFLEDTWTQIGMEGYLDLDAEMKRATEMCFPSQGMMPQAEPTVYRATLEETLDILGNKLTGKVNQCV